MHIGSYGISVGHAGDIVGNDPFFTVRFDILGELGRDFFQMLEIIAIETLNNALCLALFCFGSGIMIEVIKQKAAQLVELTKY